MKIIILIFSLLNILIVRAQIPLQIPEKKTYMYDKSEENYYDAWSFDLRIENQKIKNRDSMISELRFNDLNNAYWNRFISYYKMIPNDASDILYPFFEGIENDKDLFCHSYKEILQDPSRNIRNLGKRGVHYKKQLDLMDKVCECIIKSYNPKLLKILDSLEYKDQYFRKKYENLPKAQKKFDSLNLIVVLDLYEKYGYLNRRIVGPEYESHMFYIIQHSDLVTMEKFLPIIHKEIKLGRLGTTLYPLLHDRINMLKGKPQEFGTQSTMNEKTGNFEIYRTIEMDKVNFNRNKYGLKSLK